MVNSILKRIYRIKRQTRWQTQLEIPKTISFCKLPLKRISLNNFRITYSQTFKLWYRSAKLRRLSLLRWLKSTRCALIARSVRQQPPCMGRHRSYRETSALLVAISSDTKPWLPICQSRKSIYGIKGSICAAVTTTSIACSLMWRATVSLVRVSAWGPPLRRPIREIVNWRGRSLADPMSCKA